MEFFLRSKHSSAEVNITLDISSIKRFYKLNIVEIDSYHNTLGELLLN